MCGRFELFPRIDAIRDILNWMIHENEPGVATGEIAPTDIVPVLVLENRSITPRAMAWGFPKPGAPGVIINARQESALEKAVFRSSLLERPCLVPCTGFYEWQTIEGQAKKKKYIFKDVSHDLIYLAGFWKQFKTGDGLTQKHFVTLTTDANDRMTPYHHRMPVMINEAEQMDWLNGSRLKDFLGRGQPELCAFAVD